MTSSLLAAMQLPLDAIERCNGTLSPQLFSTKKHTTFPTKTGQTTSGQQKEPGACRSHFFAFMISVNQIFNSYIVIELKNQTGKKLIYQYLIYIFAI